MAADGAWVRGEDGDLCFLALPDPTPAEVAQLAAWTHARLVRVLERVLERHGRLGDLAADQPVLASCYGAAAGDHQVLGAEPGRRTQKVFGPVPFREQATEAPVAEVGGVNIHAGTAVDGRDRRRLERLLRYMARPPVCTERLELQDDGKVVYSFKSAWRDGTKAIVLAPLDFIARLCALVPPPRFHLVHYHGFQRRKRRSTGNRPGPCRAAAAQDADPAVRTGDRYTARAARAITPSLVVAPGPCFRH